MTIIDEYDELSKQYIKSNKEVSDYLQYLSDKRYYLDIELSKDKIELLKHPIKLVKNISERRRLIKIEKNLDEIINSPILYNCTEETGELKEDLEYASYKVKPGRVLSYMHSNKIK